MVIGEKLLCNRCGKAIDDKPGETYCGSTDGRVWHYGCAPSRTRPTPDLGDDGELERIAARLIDQGDEPWPRGTESDRLHYWRDKAIEAANNIRAVLSRSEPPSPPKESR